MASNGGPNGGGLKGMKAPLRDILPAFNLFKLQPPEPPPAPPLPVTGRLPAARRRPISGSYGVVNAADGIYAILEVNGQSQTVKPGDSLLDGSRVTVHPGHQCHPPLRGGREHLPPLTGGRGQNDQNGNGRDSERGRRQFRTRAVSSGSLRAAIKERKMSKRTLRRLCFSPALLLGIC